MNKKEKKILHFESQLISETKKKKLVAFVSNSGMIGIQENITGEEQCLIWLTKKEFEDIVACVENNKLSSQD